MKIRPADIGHFQSPQQARAYQSATALIARHEQIRADLQAADNVDGIDFNQGAGRVVAPQFKSAALPAAESEKAFHGDMQFDAAGGGVETMLVSNGRHTFEQYESRGIFGLGEKRTVLSARTPAGEEGNQIQWEEVALFADGTLDYSKFIV